MLPLKDRVVVKQFKAPEKTKGGILLRDPNSSDKDNAPNLGIVRYIGPDVRTMKPGHVAILRDKYFNNFKRGDEELLIVNEPDILGIVDREDLNFFMQKYNFEELAEFNA